MRNTKKTELTYILPEQKEAFFLLKMPLNLKNMKPIITVIFCIISIYANSQIKGGYIEYRVIVGKDELFDTLDKSMQESYIKEMESKKYTLEFDNQKSVFVYEGGLTQNGDSKHSEVYYREKDSLYSIRPSEDEDFGKLLIIENRDIKWQLHNETKMIGDYKCYKATSKLIRDNGKAGIFEFPIIAWYTPSIPITFGPLGYGGLPGLILELQERNIVYGATKISLNQKFTKKKSKLTKPKDGKRITSEELNLKIRSLYLKKN